MTNLSPETKQALKKYSYNIVDIDTKEVLDNKKSRNAAAKAQVKYFQAGIVTEIVEVVV